MLDTPTDNFPTLNPLATGMAATLSDGNLAFSFGSDDGAPATFATGSTGSYRFRVNITTLGAAAAVAVITPAAYDAITNWGNINLGAGSGQYAYRSNGDKFSGNSAVAYGASFTSSDYVEAEYDADAGTLVFYKNGTTQGTAYTGLSGPMFFAISRNASGGTAVIGTVDFGQLGTVGDTNVLSTATLPDPTIADPSAHMQTTTYTGNGSTLAVDQAGNSTFQPDLVWIKNRVDGTAHHRVFDAVRGATKALYPSGTFVEATESGVTSFDADGFTLGSQSDSNGSGEGHVAWQWKADNTSGSSNTDGSITSTVAANTTAGFSICTTSGSGGAGTFGHGLGVTPSLIIPFRRTDADSHWVFHQALGPTKGIPLNSSDAATTSVNFWNDTSPTSSIVNVGNTHNNSGDTYVFYCFAEVDGFSKAGSYVANASTDGPFVYCGFRPAWVIFFIIAGSVAGRSMLDSVRDPYNPEDSILQANTTAVESSGSSYYTDFVSNGFKLRTSSDMNSSGRTVAYMAFAESPFKTANAR
jgi:hypothetical protein